MRHKKERLLEIALCFAKQIFRTDKMPVLERSPWRSRAPSSFRIFLEQLSHYLVLYFVTQAILLALVKEVTVPQILARSSPTEMTGGRKTGQEKLSTDALEAFMEQRFK